MKGLVGLFGVIIACSNTKSKQNTVRLRPGDCKNHTEWSEEDKTCVCSWGWTGEICDQWGNWNFIKILIIY